MARQSSAQKKTVERVMHEFKHGELKSGGRRKVRNPRQAVAIALSEAGASKYESSAENRRKLRKTKRDERAGRTAIARTEGRKMPGAPKSRSTRGTAAARKTGATRKTASGARRRSTSTARQEATRQELYRRAQKAGIPGRARMTKDQLKRALARR